MENFKNTTQTKAGVKVSDISYNHLTEIWIGVYFNEKNNKWLSCAWKQSGKCINSNRPDLDLKHFCPECGAEMKELLTDYSDYTCVNGHSYTRFGDKAKKH